MGRRSGFIHDPDATAEEKLKPMLRAFGIRPEPCIFRARNPSVTSGVKSRRAVGVLPGLGCIYPVQ